MSGIVDSLTAHLSDRAYRQLTFLRQQRRWCRLRTPRTFNEKVNWRVLFDRRPELIWTCDKLSQKERVAALGLDIVVPQLVWSGTDVRELDGLPLEGRWVLKPNHTSGRGIEFGDGPVRDVEALAARMAGALRETQGQVLREWPYTHARRLLLLERFVEGDGPGAAPPDYKFFVFDGRAAMIQFDLGRFDRHRRSLFTPEWTRLDATLRHPSAGDQPRPGNLEAMVEAAEAIAGGLDFLRVDLYSDGETAWFGEVASYPGSGLERFSPRSFDHELGARWQLPRDIAAATPGAGPRSAQVA